MGHQAEGRRLVVRLQAGLAMEHLRWQAVDARQHTPRELEVARQPGRRMAAAHLLGKPLADRLLMVEAVA